MLIGVVGCDETEADESVEFRASSDNSTTMTCGSIKMKDPDPPTSPPGGINVIPSLSRIRLTDEFISSVYETAMFNKRSDCMLAFSSQTSPEDCVAFCNELGVESDGRAVVVDEAFDFRSFDVIELETGFPALQYELAFFVEVGCDCVGDDGSRPRSSS